VYDGDDKCDADGDSYAVTQTVIILMLDMVAMTVMCAGNSQYKRRVFKTVKLQRNSSDGTV